jgi:hypothetical protein
MTIHWFAYYGDRSPSVRYRAIYPLQLLQREYDVRVRLVIPERTLSGILHFLYVFVRSLFLRRGDLIVIQRVSSTGFYARMLKTLVRLKRKSTLYDIDDADHLERPPGNIFWFVQNCACVTVGSHELFRTFLPLNRNTVINTSPVPRPFFSKQLRNTGRFVIGWVGDYGGDHRVSLREQLFPALKELPFPVSLYLLGVRNERSKKEIIAFFHDAVNIDLWIPLRINWNDERWIQSQIVKFDVGIGTLNDNELHRSKSAFKVKQYLNNGVPALSTDLPENKYFVTDGKNGFICKDAQEFKKYLVCLHGMDDLSYSRISKEAKSSSRYFNIAHYCNALLALAGTRSPLHKDGSIKGPEMVDDSVTRDHNKVFVDLGRVSDN